MRARRATTPDRHVRPLHVARSNSFNHARPCAQSPSPLAALRCPAAPASTSRLPQAAAQRRACAGLPYGSSLLATTRLANGRRCCGSGEKPIASGGNDGPCGSGTATSNAARTVRLEEGHAAAQCATSRQARLWATSTTAGPLSRTAASSGSHHSLQRGCNQSRCCTRRIVGSADCQRLCQCCGPESPMPGRIRMEGVSVVFIGPTIGTTPTRAKTAASENGPADR